MVRDEPNWPTLDAVAEAIQDPAYPGALPGTTHRVPGEGSSNARVMLIGEAPGFHEDRAGRPFVGAAGTFLDELLESVGLRRPDVFVTNLIHTRPPENRDPTPEEIEVAWPYLQRQIQLIQPEVIVLLGRHSAHRFLPNVGGISRIHGRVFRRPRPVEARRMSEVGSNVATDEPEQWFLPLYHPAAGLHNEALKDTIRTDVKELKKLLTTLDRMKEASGRAKPE